jgi:hypothetical protein
MFTQAIMAAVFQEAKCDVASVVSQVPRLLSFTFISKMSFTFISKMI